MAACTRTSKAAYALSRVLACFMAFYIYVGQVAQPPLLCRGFGAFYMYFVTGALE
jgi:hypothetical protein